MLLNGEDLKSPALNLLHQKRSSPVLQHVGIGFTNSPPMVTSIQKGQLEIVVLRENCKENSWLDLPFIAQSIQKQQSTRHGHIYMIYNCKTTNSPHSVSCKFIGQNNCCSSQKVGSTTCFCAYLPINLTKRELYFTWGSCLELLTLPSKMLSK